MRALQILPQPDDSTCGPTALHAVYQHLGAPLPLQQVIDEVHFLEDGGTLAVFLGLHALRRGFKARIHSYNLRVFDPTWEDLPMDELREKVLAQLKYKRGKKLTLACEAYAEFLRLGGEVRFNGPSPSLLKSYFEKELPVLAGLSSTYLYRSKREYVNDAGRCVLDDLRGKPVGHFVVLSGMEGKKVFVADPYQGNPYSSDRMYQVDSGRLINAILMGIVTYDANLLIISKEPL